jgi:predicted amidohydrolase
MVGAAHRPLLASVVVRMRRSSESVIDKQNDKRPLLGGGRILVRLLLTAVLCAKGDLTGNLARHLKLLERGKTARCDLVLLPEMSLTGSSPEAAVMLDHEHVVELVHATADGPSLCFGLAEAIPAAGLDQRPAITQVLAVGGQILRVHRKAGIAPDEKEHYRSGSGSRPIDLAGVSLSIALCAEIGVDTSYTAGSAVVLGPSAPGLYGPRREGADWRRGFEWWRSSVLADAARLLQPRTCLAVSTQSGATVDEDFPGWCALITSGGRVVAELPDWRHGCLVVDLDGSGDLGPDGTTPIDGGAGPQRSEDTAPSGRAKPGP